MTVEYDLVVIGGSAVGIYAAVAAARLNARVALIEPPKVEANGLDTALTYRQCLAQVAQIDRQLQAANLWGFHWETADALPPPVSLNFSEAMTWAKTAISTLESHQSFAVLAALGIDVISGSGQFCRRPHLIFEVSETKDNAIVRRLRARAYLLATGTRPDIPEIEGLESTGYLTTESLAQLQQLPESIAIVGGDPAGVELAQSLARMGSRVTLAVSSPQILVKEDLEAAQLIQAMLEAEGVTVLTQSEVVQARLIEGKKWLQAGNKAIEADEILLVTGHQPNVEELNLEAVGVKWHRHYIQTNQKLQTTNPCIYACGEAIGGYRFAHLATYEASVALKNALFWPLFNVDYQGIPWAILTQPQLARVGMTEAQARRRYGKDVLVVRQYFKHVEAAVIQGETTGFCKLIGRGNGEILGASMVGPMAAELIGAIALAMQHKIKIGAIASLVQIAPTYSEIITQTAQAWKQQRFAQNRRMQDFLEGFFNWRRSWTK